MKYFCNICDAFVILFTFRIIHAIIEKRRYLVLGKHFEKKSILKKNEKKHSKNTTKITSNNKFLFVLFFFFISLFIISIMLLINWLKENNNANHLLGSILDNTNITEIADSENTELVNPPAKTSDYWNFIKMPLINVDFDSLLKQNPDTVGWIHVNNTNINYPIVQSNNNTYYLTRAFDGTKNSAGWIFADYRNDMKSFGKNTIIYGHSRLNQTMFATLKNVLENSWYKDKSNHIIRLSTPTENTMWQIFSVYKIEPESYYITTSFSTDQLYKTFLDTIQSRSIYQFNVELSTKDKILTLSTCNNTAATGRIVVHAKLIKREVRK